MNELRKRHRGHARPLKNLEQRYVLYADAIELDCAQHCGKWLADFAPDASELRLDLGCGKGQFTVEEAQRNPDVFFIGLDYERPCIALAAQRAIELDVKNVMFALADAEDLGVYFAKGELSQIYLNFSTPHPRKKHASERLTHVGHLMEYRPLLGIGGVIEFKTDSPMFFDYSLFQFEMAGYEIEWSSRDLLAERGDLPSTEYQERLVAKGAVIHALRAIVADKSTTLEQTCPQSLFDYLPEDLDTLEYVPYGMEGAVVNFRNKRAKDKARNIEQGDESFE